MAPLARRAITVVGLGPGRRGLLTIDALEALRAATRLYLRTVRHPAVAEIRGDLRPDVQIHTFDGLCATAPSREAACLRIAETLLAAAAEGPLVYAVPGHPLIGERSVGLLLDGAAERRLEVHVVDGLGTLDHVFGALRRDPVAGGLQIVDALEVVGDALCLVELGQQQVHRRLVGRAGSVHQRDPMRRGIARQQPLLDA